MVNYNFGEVILSVLQKERDRKQEQEKYAQTVAFQERQYDLLNAYKQQNALLNQEKFTETKRHNEAMENRGSDKPEKMPNILLPELSDNEADYYGTRKEKPMQTTTTQTGEMEDIVLGDVGYDYQISKKDYKPKQTVVNVNGGYDDTNLDAEWEVNALNVLERPNTKKKDVDENNNKIMRDMTSEEYNMQIEDNLNKVFSGLKLGTRSQQFFTNIKNMYKRTPEPNELRDEVAKHIEGGGLDKKELKGWTRFLNLYSRFYQNIK